MDILNAPVKTPDECIMENYVKGFSVPQIETMTGQKSDKIYEVLSSNHKAIRKLQRYRYLKNGTRIVISDEQRDSILNDHRHGVHLTDIAYNNVMSVRSVRDVINGLR